MPKKDPYDPPYTTPVMPYDPLPEFPAAKPFSPSRLPDRNFDPPKQVNIDIFPAKPQPSTWPAVNEPVNLPWPGKK